MRTVIVSGGFDPLHRGHLEFFQAAAKLGDQLVVIVENDAWVAKKHPPLQTQYDRCVLIRAMQGVSVVVANNRDDGDCSYRVLEVRERFSGGAVVYAVGADHGDVDTVPECKSLTEAGVPILVVPTPFSQYHSSSMLAAATKPQWENPIPMVAVVLECATTPGAVLLGRRPGTGALELPGGFVEPGETLEDAARREVREELGQEMQFCRYFHSVHGRYRDGRKITVAGFRGLINLPPLRTPEWTETVYAQAMPPPDTVWDNEADRDTLGNHFAWRQRR